MNPWARVRTTALGLMLIGGGAASGGCAINPATGQHQLSFIGEQQEIAMGKQSDPEIVASMGLVQDQQVQSYVQQLGKRLAAASERPDLPWTFRVIDDPTVNAFAVPGGYVYVTRGLLTHITSEAQLAGVLGHEIGHVTARHSVNDMSKQQLAQIGLGVGMILSPTLASLGNLAVGGMQVLFLKYSRDHENQADELGVRYMTRLNYDPNQLADVMEMLDRSSQIESSSGKVPEWLSTHPNPGNRVAHIEQVAKATEADASRSGARVVRRDELLRHLNGLVFGDNPREGYFEGSTFLHPDLRFSFRFPSGWKTANGKSAVQAMAPNQDAIMTIGEAKGSPQQAMQQFENDQNIQVGNAGRTSINGHDAVEADFAAATQQGELRGTVAFVSNRGSTLAIMGYSGAGSWGAYQGSVSRSIESFATLNDSRALNVQPKRMEIVQAPSSMTFSTFMQRYPSVEKPEIIELINQVDGNTRLNSGALYKRVVTGR